MGSTGGNIAMRKNTSLFWVMVTVTLAGVYLFSNHALLTRVESRFSKLWRDVISRTEVHEVLPDQKAEEREEKSVPKPEAVAKSIPEKPEQQASDTETETSQHQREKVEGVDGDRQQLARKTEAQQSPLPKVGLEDVLAPKAHKAEKEQSKKETVQQKTIPLEVLKKVYAKHLEALKILNSGMGNENGER